MTQLTHPFERLAPGPYQFTGMYDASGYNDRLRHCDELMVGVEEGGCIGSCDHCGTAITIAVQFVGSNGVKFKTGETCAKKAFEPGTIALTEATQACNARRTTIKKAKIQSQYARAIEWIEGSNLADIPHPKGFTGLTLRDFLGWYRENAGKAKFIAVCENYGFAK
jgi:hypothetical protein